MLLKRGDCVEQYDRRTEAQLQDVRAFLDSVLDEDIHTKRVDSLANATLGVMTGASLGVVNRAGIVGGSNS